MDHIGVLRLLPLALPGKFIIGAAVGQPVIAGGEDDIILLDDAGADLCVRVLTALRGQQRHAHKIFIPGDIVRPFHTLAPFLSLSRKCCAQRYTLKYYTIHG